MAATTLALPATSQTANLQAYASGIVGTLSAYGWVQTSDTGQANFGTITEPGTLVSAGYQIWRMADSLQSTTPVFLRIEVGQGNNTHDPAIMVTVGFGTDGAGNINSTYKTVPYIYTWNGNQGVSTNTYNCYFSGDTNRFSFMMWDDPSLVIGFFFSIERLHDASGNDVAGGVVIHTRNGGGNQATYGSWYGAYCSTIVLNSASPLFNTYPWKATAPTLYNAQGTMINGSTVGSAVPIPYGPDPKNPSIGPLIYLGSDFTPWTSVVIPIYGSNHTYMPTSKPPGGQAGVIQQSVSGWLGNSIQSNGDGFILMRYE